LRCIRIGLYVASALESRLRLHLRGRRQRARDIRPGFNGAYLQDEPELAPLLQERTVQAVSALCDGGPTIIVIETWHPASSEKASVSIHVDDAGKLLAAGSKVVPSGL